MSIYDIFILTTVALLFYLFAAGPVRGWLVFISSIVCLFWLQPALPIRYLDFWLPALTLWIIVLVWLTTLPKSVQPSRSDLLTSVVLLGLILAIASTRYFFSTPSITSSLPPGLNLVLIYLLPGLLILLMFEFWRRKLGAFPSRWLTGFICVFILFLITLKSSDLSLWLAKGLRLYAGQTPKLATAFDIRWIGFSYISFRLIHVIRDRILGKLESVDLRTFISYVIFFPSIVAGPIDRLERFAGDFRKAEQPVPLAESSLITSPPSFAMLVLPFPLSKRALRLSIRWDANLGNAVKYLLWGLFKKFVVADILALVALSPSNALQVREAGWLWLLLYIYAFQIYFDFSGYSDIAIGLGLLLGVRLPDNFSSPYLKPNLTQFWNAWHMSLTQWLRVYLFNPLIRALRSKKMPAVQALFIGQVTTMAIIGLWHGVSWNFLIWGLWHGLGQFIQNRWSGWVKPWFDSHPLSPSQAFGLRIFNIFLTFHYVALGWLWFLLPTPGFTWQVFLRLFGIGFH